MTESQNTGTFRVLAACLLGAAMFAVLPASATSPIRDVIRLAVAPGQRLVTSAVATAQSRWQKMLDEKLATQQQELDQLHSEIAQSQLQKRRALLAAESASQELASVRRNGASPFDVETAQPLLRPHAVRAAVLGREILSELKSRRILDRGDTDGVAADLWVLNGELPIVQAGSELSIADGLPVFAGRCVVGRIVEAGRWTSSLQVLTEPSFRARAVLARSVSSSSTAETFSFGAEGLIEGRSDLKQNGLCELAQIPATEHVDVGMPVYSPPGHAVDAPMLFGHVVSAEVPPGALHWVITVQPAADLKNLSNVEIVVPKLSTDFESTNSENLPPPASPSSSTQAPITSATLSARSLRAFREFRVVGQVCNLPAGCNPAPQFTTVIPRTILSRCPETKPRFEGSRHTPCAAASGRHTECACYSISGLVLSGSQAGIPQPASSQVGSSLARRSRGGSES